MRTLQEFAERFPGPEFCIFLGVQFQPSAGKAHRKGIAKGTRTFVDAGWQDPPDNHHQPDPQKGKYQEGISLDLFQSKQHGRQNREHIHYNEQNAYFWPGKKMVTEGL